MHADDKSPYLSRDQLFSRIRQLEQRVRTLEQAIESHSEFLTLETHNETAALPLELPDDGMA